MPPRRHNKNILESKHGVIREIFLRLKNENSNAAYTTDFLLVQQSFRISNDLYGNDELSAHELAKGYTRPVIAGTYPVLVPRELIEAQKTLASKRKLTLILRSKATVDTPVKPGDVVQVFIKLQHDKRGKWSGPKTVLHYDPSSRCVTVPGSNGRKIRAAVEDVRFDISNNNISRQIQEAIDCLDREVDASLHSFSDCTIDETSAQMKDPESQSTQKRIDDDDFSLAHENNHNTNPTQDVMP